VASTDKIDNNKHHRPTRRFWRDGAASIALVLVIATSWCAANSMWTRAAWKRPTVYLGPYLGPSKPDVLLHLAFIRAARDGHFVPFCSKIVPELGAPNEANWNDWPIVEEFPIYGMGLLARGVGIFAALNIALLFCHVLAGLAFYFVARFCQIGLVWSFTAALAFGLTSFIFSESPDHPLVALCWHIPLFLLVWNWVGSETGVRPRTGKFWLGIAIGFVAGLQMPYYAAVFCQLTLLGAIAMFARSRRWPQLISACCFVGATILAFALMNLDTWIYQLRMGPNPAALVREYKWVEIYGLKLVDFVFPPLTHRWEAFRSLAQWQIHNSVLIGEGNYFGIIGLVALSILTGVVVFALIKRNAMAIPKEAWQVLWIILFFTVGGLNAIVALFGFTYLRTGCRFGVVILAISLLFAARWLNQRNLRLAWSIPLALAACVLALLDQVPRPPSMEENTMVARQISSDQKFVSDLEKALPNNAMIFQFPVMDFPEAPLRDVGGYDHLRPYLFSRTLRFSFGSVKGRAREQWQRELDRMTLPEVLATLKSRGFSALYVNRKAYPNDARDIEANLRALGYDQKIDNIEGDLFCVLLTPSRF
jgi:phosphoglycerol transferase